VNNSGGAIDHVFVGNVTFTENLSLCGGGCSTGFPTVAEGTNSIVVYQTATSSAVSLGSLGPFSVGKAYAVNIRNVGGYCAELWQMIDTSTVFNSNTTRSLIGTTCGGSAGTGASQFDGIYTGSWSLTCPVCGDTAAGTFTATVTNGVLSNIKATITSGTHGISFASGTVSSSGAITGTGAAPSGQCSSSVSSFTGQITTTTSGDAGMTMTYSRPASPACGAESGTVTATRTKAGSASDTSAPTVPTGTSATASSTTQINLSWTASTDNVAVTGYRVYRNGVQVGSPAGTSYSDTGLSSSTTYTYTVAACDAAGNCSGRSVAVSVTTLTPAPVCTSTQVLQGGVCVTPIATPSQVVSNPAANLSVDATGAMVVTASTAPIVLNPAAPENALVKLQTLQPVSFTSGNTTLQYTDQVGAAQLVVRTVAGQPQLEVSSGTVQINSPSSGNTISVISSNQKTVGSILTQTAADSVIVAKTDTTAAVFVDVGKVNYQGPGQNIPVYQGENTQLDTTGKLNQLALGSLEGKKQVPGDPLPLATTPTDAKTKVPNLEGNLPRFNNALTLKDIAREMIKGLVGDTNGLGQLSYDKSTGVITYAVGQTTYRLIALGDVLVQLNQFAATNASATAGGAYTLASLGIQMSLSGAVGYFSDLQTLVKAADSKGTLNLKPTGAIEIRVGGGHYVAMPGLSANLPNNPTLIPGVQSDASGYVIFRDHLGTLQTLYPAFLDVDSLSIILKSAVPAVSLSNNGNGTVTAALSGQIFTLRPEYSVVDQPAGHAADLYWQDTGLFYFHNSDQSAQGFGVR